MAVNIKKEFGKQRKPDLSTLVYGKIPPQAPELEEAVLGSIMLESYRYDEVVGVLHTPECFYVDANQKIYKAIIDLKGSGMPVDLLTVTDQIRKSSNLEIVGGAHYLTKLTFSVSSTANVFAHACLIKEKFIQREVIRISGQAIGDGYADETDAFDLLDKLERELYELRANIISAEPQHIKKAVVESSEEIEKQLAAETEITGTPTGFNELDRQTSGWQPTDLVILAARPAVGKTAFVLNTALASANNGKPVAIFSLEMSKGQLLKRLYSNMGDIFMNYWKKPKTMPDHIRQHLFGTVMPKVAALPMYIDDTAMIDAATLSAKVKQLKRKYGIELVIIDYLQLMQGNSEKGANREQEVSKISRTLKVLAKDEQVAIIALSQLNRGVEGRASPVPKLSDLRESGSIEQDADIVGFLYREQDGENTTQDVIYLELAKNRAGETQLPIKLIFAKEFQRFKEEAESFGNPFPAEQYQKPNAGMPTRLPHAADKEENLPF